MNQRLFRSRDDRVIAGVAGGLAAMLNVDPSLVRILWVILVPLTGGFVILLYFVMAVVVPELPIGEDRWQTWDRPWPDPWADQGTMGQMGAMGPTGDAGPTEWPGATGPAGAAAADATDGLGDDATRRYPPVGTTSDLRTSATGPGPGRGTGPLPGGWRPRRTPAVPRGRRPTRTPATAACRSSLG